MTNEGIRLIYIATGSPRYLFGALYSALSARAAGNEYPTTIVTNTCLPFPFGRFGINTIAAPSMHAEGIKTLLNKFTEASRSLYLDADTIVTGNLDPIAGLLSDGDLALLPRGRLANVREVFTRRGRYAREDSFEIEYTLDHYPEQAYWYSGGHIAFRSSAQRLFKNFRFEWKRFKKLDEPALVRAVVNSAARVAPIPSDLIAISHRFPTKATILHRPRGMTGSSVAQMAISPFHKHYYPNIHQSLLREFAKFSRI